jgi:LPS-assembly protein
LAYENLTGKNSDRYQYILPYYNFSRQIFNNSILNIDISSSGNNNLRETNKLITTLNNDININSNDFFSDFGFKNTFQTFFKNSNSVGKNVDTTKSTPKIELKNIINIETSLPLLKYNENSINTITPKASFRINPGDMNNASNTNRTLTANNLFDINRLGLNDFEQGKSLTLGLDYRKESLLDINKYFEMKFGGVLRDVKQNNIPTSSSINQTSSNLFGSINYAMSDKMNLGYDFSLDNDFSTFEQNSINLGLSFFPISEEKKKFNTYFSFSESNGKQGDANALSNSTTINFDENNYLTFNTRRNRKIDFTEYYNLVYEYKNDCLVAGIKFNKSFYQDRDLKPKEELLLTITFFPITQYDQKIKESVWTGDNAIQNFLK